MNIILKVDEIVNLGKEELEEKWRGWNWAVSSNNEGWIPMQILEISENGKTARIKENYSAKEIDVEIDDLVTVIKELNGWSWVKKLKNSEEGWIPNENFE